MKLEVNINNSNKYINILFFSKSVGIISLYFFNSINIKYIYFNIKLLILEFCYESGILKKKFISIK